MNQQYPALQREVGLAYQLPNHRMKNTLISKAVFSNFGRITIGKALAVKGLTLLQ